MTVDHKIASHMCNVVRRQLQASFPDLLIHFIVHSEHTRIKSFQRDIPKIQNHPAGQSIEDFFSHTEEGKKQLSYNKSRFSCIGKYRNPGFLGFFQSREYMAICFINTDRFSNEDNLRNHAFHLAWHSLKIYLDDTAKTSESDSLFGKKNIALPDHNPDKMAHQNLVADIFATCLQYFSGREGVLNNLATKRMHDTITAETGFIAENFPFPICLDTLEFHLEQGRYKNIKKQVKTALNITNDIAATFGLESIEQWRSFAIPAQTMAWLGTSKEAILGAALYTGENTYAQSTADLIAERLHIKPKYEPLSEEYNPFTSEDANERSHLKQCKSTIDNILARIHSEADSSLLLEVIKKQHTRLKQGSVTGWCAFALLRANETMQQCESSVSIEAAKEEAKKAFLEDIHRVPWETLVHFSQKIIYKKRNGADITEEQLNTICQSTDEFTTIGYTLNIIQKQIKEKGYGYENLLKTKESPKNIGDFINPSIIKR